MSNSRAKALKATIPLAPVGEGPVTGTYYFVNIGVDKFFNKLPSYLNTNFDFFFQILFAQYLLYLFLTFCVQMFENTEIKF